jgi:hypothetical protein
VFTFLKTYPFIKMYGGAAPIIGIFSRFLNQLKELYVQISINMQEDVWNRNMSGKKEVTAEVYNIYMNKDF